MPQEKGIDIAALKEQIKEEMKQEMAERVVKQEVTNERQAETDLRNMKDIIEAQPKVALFIPFDEMNEEKYVEISVNQVKYYAERGKETMVPQCIKERWDECYRMNMELRRNIRVTQIDVN